MKHLYVWWKMCLQSQKIHWQWNEQSFLMSNKKYWKKTFFIDNCSKNDTLINMYDENVSTIPIFIFDRQWNEKKIMSNTKFTQQKKIDRQLLKKWNINMNYEKCVYNPKIHFWLTIKLENSFLMSNEKFTQKNSFFFCNWHFIKNETLICMMKMCLQS